MRERAAEVLAVFRTVGDAQRGAVDAVDRKSQELVGLGAVDGPAGSRLLEEPEHGQSAQSLSRLMNGAWDKRRSLGEGEAELVDDLDDGKMAKKGHAEHEPNDLLGGQFPTADGGRAGAAKGLQDGL